MLLKKFRHDGAADDEQNQLPKRISQINMIIRRLNENDVDIKEEIQELPIITLTVELYERELLDFESFLDEELEKRGTYFYVDDSPETANKVEILAILIDKMKIEYPDVYEEPKWDTVYQLLKPTRHYGDLIMFYKERIYAWVCLKDLYRTMLEIPSTFVVLNAVSFTQPLLLKSKRSYLNDWMNWRETQSTSGGIILFEKENYEAVIMSTIYHLQFHTDFSYREHSMFHIEDHEEDSIGEPKCCQLPPNKTNAAMQVRESDFPDYESSSSDSSSDESLFQEFTYLTPANSKHANSIFQEENPPANNTIHVVKVFTTDRSEKSESSLMSVRSVRSKVRELAKEMYSYRAGSLLFCHETKIPNWLKEVSNRMRLASFTDSLPLSWDLGEVCGFECIIISYEMLNVHNFDFGSFLTVHWSRIIADDPISVCTKKLIWKNVCRFNGNARFILTEVTLSELNAELINLFLFLKWPAYNFKTIWKMLYKKNTELHRQLLIILEPIVLNYKDIGKVKGNLASSSSESVVTHI